jgi:hypothetical protein
MRPESRRGGREKWTAEMETARKGREEEGEREAREDLLSC